jgi:hypothetical protein
MARNGLDAVIQPLARQHRIRYVDESAASSLALVILELDCGAIRSR